MALYLIQHGKSLPKEEDPKQALSAQGIEESEKIAKVAADYGIRPRLIEHSPKDRARQTAEIFAGYLKPDNGFRERSGIKALDDVTAIYPELKTEDGLMLVGHLPFMERLVSYMLTGRQDMTVFKFQNSGIVCLEQEEESRNWFIKWALMPHIG